MERTDLLPGIGTHVHPRLRAALVVLAVPAAAVLLYFWNPAGFPLWVRCPFHAITGLFCPGCGTLRALHELVHGHVLAAIDLNVLSMTALPFLAYPFLSEVTFALRGRPLPALRVGPWWGWLVFALVLTFWVLRNVPVEPFTLLAP